MQNVTLSPPKRYVGRYSTKPGGSLRKDTRNKCNAFAKALLFVRQERWKNHPTMFQELLSTGEQSKVLNDT